MGRGLWGIVVSFLLLWACKSDPVDTENPDNKKPDPSTFGFTLLKITDVKEISVERLKKQLKSESGWTIKSIKIDNESFAEVTGSLPNLKIILKKSGTFTASITLQKKGWQDFVLKDCKIQVVLPKFSFSKFTQNKSKKTITSAEILKQIAGAQAAGYSIKSIVVSDENFAKVSGTAPKLQIDIQKVGKFTATIVLSHKSFFEITLKDCAFEIVPEFIFDKLIVSSSGSKTITAAQILGQIAGAVAAGYTIKSIAITEDTKKIATVKNDTSIDFTKEGIFKATLVLQKDQHSDITLEDCAFEVSGKKAAPSLTFKKLERKFSSAPITKAEILGQIKEDTTGWTLKSVVLSDGSFGDVNLSNFSISLKKIGNFSAKIVFEKAGHLDSAVTGSFEITKGTAASLKFSKLARSFKGDQTITAAQILGQIAGVKTWGYALKSIGKISDANIAAANGTQITIKKVGSFTAELILESPNYKDVTLQASFEVSGKNAAPVLSFAALKRNYSGNKIITKAQILNQITATSGQADWGGFTLKSIVLTENASLARVNNATFELTILKAGTFKARLTFTKDTYVDAVVLGTFEIAKVTAPSLKFTTFSQKFGGSNTISRAAILGKITGNRAGYVLKSIVPSDNSFASVSAAFEMTLRRAGNFTATITLQRENYEDAIIPNCSFKIAPGDAPTDLRLTAFARKFSDSRTITAADIFAKISGKKDGYVLKSISINSGNDVARVSGTKPALQINVQKAGTFRADIVLERANYQDATVPNVIFTIQKAAAPSLGFTKLRKLFLEIITAADILANVTGTGKVGYTLKSIAITSGGDVAALSGLKEVVSKKIGTFKATLVLERANYEDATINDANFEIVKGTAAKLTFDKLTKPFGETITAANILTNVKGSGKTGYTLKSIAITSGGDVAALTGGSKAIVSKKSGTFKATLVLESANYEDATIKGASFEIAKGRAPSLTFTKFTGKFSGGATETITATQIFEKIGGKKDGYSLKSLTGLDGNIAELSGVQPNFKIIVKKVGAFTADMVLEKGTNYEDAKVTGTFEISLGDAPTGGLTFKGVSWDFNKGNAIGVTDILKETVTKKDGYTYTLKSITDLKHLRGLTGLVSDLAELSGTGPDLKVIFKKAGAIRATLVFEIENYQDATIRDATFTISNGDAASLTFGKLSKPLGETITAADILANVKGTGKAGYTLKSIAITSGGDVAALSGLREIVSKKIGTFRARLVLEKANFGDVTIDNADFEITKKAAPTLSFTEFTGQFSGGGTETITATQILENVGGKKDGYTLKSLTGLNSKIAELSGTKPNFDIIVKKAATFTANMVLEHADYQDLRVTGTFAIAKGAALTGLRFSLYKKFNNDKNNAIIDEAKILAELSGNKMGYTLKAFTGISHPAVAELSGAKKIIIKKEGSFSVARLTLENDKYEDVTFTNKNFSYTNIFNVVGGELRGYTDRKYRKSIKVLNFASVVDGQTVTSIRSGAFADAELTSLTIPDSVTTIGNLSFWSCSLLTSVTLSDKLTTIGQSAFLNCSALTSLTLSNKVTTIGTEAFLGCLKLTVTIQQTDPTKITLGNRSFGAINLLPGSGSAVKKIRVPAASLSTYQAAAGWSTYSSIMEGY